MLIIHRSVLIKTLHKALEKRTFTAGDVVEHAPESNLIFGDRRQKLRQNGLIQVVQGRNSSAVWGITLLGATIIKSVSPDLVT